MKPLAYHFFRKPTPTPIPPTRVRPWPISKCQDCVVPSRLTRREILVYRPDIFTRFACYDIVAENATLTATFIQYSAGLIFTY